MALLQIHNQQSDYKRTQKIMKTYSLNDLVHNGLLVSATGQPTYSPTTVAKYLKRFGYEPTKLTVNGMAYALTREQIEEMNRMIVAPYQD
jgi:hypothetical protein